MGDGTVAAESGVVADCMLCLFLLWRYLSTTGNQRCVFVPSLDNINSLVLNDSCSSRPTIFVYVNFLAIVICLTITIIPMCSGAWCSMTLTDALWRGSHAEFQIRYRQQARSEWWI